MSRTILVIVLLYLSFNALGHYTSEGILWNNSSQSRDTEVTILNEDNSIYLKISLKGDSQPKLPYGFNPFAIDIPENIFLMEVIEEDKERYKVSIGENKYKFVSKSEKSIKYYKWADFIVKYEYISLIIDKKKNPIRVSPTIYSKTVKYIDYDTYSINGVKVVGNWLRVKVEDNESFDKFTTFGWVKWKDKDGVVIDFRLYD